MSWTETEAIYTELGNGYTVLRPAFVFEFYVDASFNPHARKLIERIRGVFPPDSTFYCINKNGRSYRELKPRSWTRLLNTLDRLDEASQFYMMKDAPDFHVEDYSLELALGGDGRVQCGLPLSFLDERGADGVADFIAGLVDEFPIVCGTAGLGFHAVWARECEQEAMPVNIRAARRYWGLMVRNRGEEERLHGRFKSAHWLTYVGPSLLEELGGESAGRELASEELEVRAAGGGVLFRAGREPPIGDTESGASDVELMRRVNAFIRPVRIDAWSRHYSNLFFTDPAECDAWLTRFDD